MLRSMPPTSSSMRLRTVAISRTRASTSRSSWSTLPAVTGVANPSDEGGPVVATVVVTAAAVLHVRADCCELQLDGSDLRSYDCRDDAGVETEAPHDAGLGLHPTDTFGATAVADVVEHPVRSARSSAWEPWIVGVFEGIALLINSTA